MSRRMRVPLNLYTASSDPEIAEEGDIYINTITKNIRVYNGTVWFELTPPSDDPTPFYRHTHAFDGSVHTIDIHNPITFFDINENSGPAEEIPLWKMDGGTPMDDNSGLDPEFPNAFVGGSPGSIPEPEEDYNILDGGGSADLIGSELDLGGSN